MHIVIVGAGISGLSLYLWLHHFSLDSTNTITIYESRLRKSHNQDELNASLIGGALGLSSIGLKVLRRLDPSLEAEVKAAGHRIASWRMSNARGWELGSVQGEGGGDGEEGVLIARDGLLTILRGRVPEEAIVGGKVREVKVGEGSKGRNVVVLEDESGEKEVEADLVVGCDGIWSKVRDAVLGKGKEVEPHYEGLVGVGGFVPTSKLDGVPDGQMNVVFGRNGFFGYGYTSPSAQNNQGAGWWSTYTLPSCPPNWRTIDRSSIRTQILSRHTSWKNEVIQRVLQDLDVEELSLYPTFTTPQLPTWEKGGCVLVGDGAHALQPSSGQGASMALEDCETLALLLSHYQPPSPSPSPASSRSQPASADPGTEVEHHWWLRATRLYSDMRRPRLALVHKRAGQMGAMKSDMGVLQEMVMYGFIWGSGKLGLAAKYNRALSEYDVPTEVKNAVRKEKAAWKAKAKANAKEKKGRGKREEGIMGTCDFAAVPT